MVWVCPACFQFPLFSQETTSWESPFPSCPSPTWLLLYPKHTMPFWTSQPRSQRFSSPTSIPRSPGLSSALESSPSPKARGSRATDLLLPRGGSHLAKPLHSGDCHGDHWSRWVLLQSGANPTITPAPGRDSPSPIRQEQRRAWPPMLLTATF